MRVSICALPRTARYACACARAHTHTQCDPSANQQTAQPIASHLTNLQDVTWARALDSTEYMPGLVGMNNMKLHDYANVIVQILARIQPIR